MIFSVTNLIDKFQALIRLHTVNCDMPLHNPVHNQQRIHLAHQSQHSPHGYQLHDPRVYPTM